MLSPEPASTVATTTLRGFFPALGLFTGYLVGISLLVVAVAKPILPNNTGIMIIDGMPRGFGVFAPLPEGAEVWVGLPRSM